MITLPTNITCGYFDSGEFGNIDISPKRKVAKYELEFYLEDGKTTMTDGRTFDIKKNHIQIACPGQIRHSVLPFKTAYIKFNADKTLAERLSSATEYFRCSHPDEILSLLDEIILLNEVKSSDLLFYGKLLLLIDLILVDSGIPSERSGESYAVISNAKRFIENNFEKPITLRDIADSVHLSHIYFHSIFTKSVGTSPHEYLIKCRIENAKKLLWNTDISVTVIAEKCGFGCQQYMNKVFKKETGTTPVSYRKNNQKNYSL